MKKLSIIVILVFLSFGCATTPRTIPQNSLKKINKVATISLLGDKILFKQLGTTVFNNVEKYYPVRDWGIDDHVTALIKENISRNTSMQFIDINFDKEQFNDIYKSTQQFVYADFDLDIIQSELNKIRSEYDVDSLILITKRRVEIPGTYQYVNGYALYNRSFLGIKAETKIYLSASMSVIDLRQNTKIANQVIFFRKSIDNSYWNENISDLTEAQLTFIRNTIKEELELEIQEAITKLQLA